MSGSGNGNKSKRTQMIGVVMALVMTVLLIQLWLVTLALEGYLGARATLALPTFIASLACLGLNLWLLKYVNDIDRLKD